MAAPLGHPIPVTPAGEHAAIDVSVLRSALAALTGADPLRRADAVRTVLHTPSRFAPPVLHAVSEAVFESDREEGAWRFYAAQLRTRFDITRCADPTVEGAAAILTGRFGPPVNRWVFAEPSRLRPLAERAVEWDRATPHDYDHRWVNLHGTGAFGAGDGRLSVPADEWDAIAERVRVEYLEGVDEVLRELPGPAR